ncbi:MAG: hypothetical protein OYM47_15625 [Gemmatimonadota bacterium]|nr:hypothetical protein [Gemmatimonadota bacterium]
MVLCQPILCELIQSVTQVLGIVPRKERLKVGTLNMRTRVTLAV